ncbi:CatB-related O-acetyltransferase [Oceanicella sp. SM1341]|uniref:CatB-related O-acetyltransferase n=1 Tax=Oceanicella sp. SM1341 TaxID=1548889 RepID=UPI00130057A0|nr:CatB-related O-acetyltransferase [Oceanicella sp. SM1341]
MLTEKPLGEDELACLENALISPVDVHPNQNIGKVRYFPGATLEPFTQHNAAGNTLFMSSLGYMSYTSSQMLGAVVGRYCSLAGNIRLMGNNHPTDWVTTHIFAYSRKYGDIIRRNGFPDWDATSPVKVGQPTLNIGNDVWIGRDAVLARGITIGDGAIVAGSAVVTKDVPPYAVVGGVPAKIIRFRFPDEVIERVQETQWWNYAVSSFGDVKFKKVDQFIEAFPDMKLRKLPEMRLSLEKVLSGEEVFPAKEEWL